MKKLIWKVMKFQCHHIDVSEVVLEETLHLNGQCCTSAKFKFAPDCLWSMNSYLSAMKDIRKSQADNYFQVNNLFNKFRYFAFMKCSLWIQKNSILILYVKNSSA